MVFGRTILIAVAVCALGLSACGRKGPLEPPVAEQAPPGTVQQPDAEPEERKGFLLDFLIE